MPDRTLLEAFDRLYVAERRSIIHYVVEVASPIVSGDADREVSREVEQAYLESQTLLEALRDLALTEEHYPPEGHFDLRLTIYNYSTYSRILEILVPRLRTHREVLRDRVGALADWREARAVAERLLAATDGWIGRFQKMLESRSTQPQGS